MKQHGFVLIELLITFVLIGIMASVIMLQLNSFIIRQDIDNAAKALVGDLRWMQQLSINSGEGSNLYIIFYRTEPYGYFITLNRKIIKNVMFPQKVMIDWADTGDIYFGVNGYIYPRRGVTILLRNDREFRHIIIDKVGRVRIFNPNMPIEKGMLYE